MVRNSVVIAILVVGIGAFLGMSPQPDKPVAAQDALQKFFANTGRFYVASFMVKDRNKDVLALLDQGELQKLDKSGKLQAVLQGERGGVLLVLSAFTAEEARSLAGPLLGKDGKSVKLTIRPALGTKSFADPAVRKPIAGATMQPYEAAYAMKGKAWVSEGNETSRSAIPQHVTRISSLFDNGTVKLYISFEDSEDPRGFFIFTGKTRDELKKLMADDPMVTAKWLTFDFLSCKAPQGTFK